MEKTDHFSNYLEGCNLKCVSFFCMCADNSYILSLLGLWFSISYSLSALWLLILHSVELAFTCQKCRLASDCLDSNLGLTLELGQLTLLFHFIHLYNGDGNSTYKTEVVLRWGIIMLALRTASEIWQILNIVFFNSADFNAFNMEIKLPKFL